MSSLCKKYIMALSGLVLVGFVFGHMLGNLQMFLHPDWINEYAYKLQHLPYGLLWVVRGFLLLCVVAHVATAIMLVIENKKARPDKYVNQRPVQATFASRTMKWSGIILLAFIIFHIAHFTVKSVHPEFKQLETHLQGTDGKHGASSRTIWGVYDKLSGSGALTTAKMKPVHDVYSMVAIGFSPRYWYVSLFYIIAMGLLCLHLSHGISSMFQSVGLRNSQWRKRLGVVAPAIAWIVFLGFSILPLAGLLQMYPYQDQVQTGDYLEATAAVIEHTAE